MYNYEKEQLKNAFNDAMQRDQTKAQYADCDSTACSTGVLGTAFNGGYTLAEKLENNAAGSYQQGQDYSRASSILRAHPEFEELIWLIRSGLV